MTASDYDAVGRIFQAGVDSNNATFEVVSPNWAEFDASHIPACRLVATVGDAVVGWAALSPTSTRHAYRGVAEVSIYIDPGHVGQGVGTRLLRRLINDAENAGYWTLQSSIISENLASIGLHEKCGFRTVGTREKIGQDQAGQWRDTTLMERRSADLVHMS